MAARTRADERGRATESKFYIPAGPTSSSVAGRIESLWAALFNHGIETSR